MNKKRCEFILKHNSYRHLTHDEEYVECHHKAHNYIHQLEDEIEKLKNKVEGK